MNQSTEKVESGRAGLQRVIHLAIPVVVAELGWVCMGIEDSIFVGHRSASELGAVCLGNVLNAVLGLFGAGMLLGLDPLVARSFGASRRSECRDWLFQGLYIAAFLAPLLTAAMWGAIPLFMAFGVKSETIEIARPFTYALSWSLIPLCLFAAFRRYLQAIGAARVVMFALVTANLVNIGGDWILLRSFGVQGIGWSTCLARFYMAAVLGGYALWREGDFLARFPKPDFRRLAQLIRLGGPAAAQLLIEVGMFAAASLFAGRLRTSSLAAHQIALNIAGFTFMVPLGISSAAAIVVGQALGAGDVSQAKRDGSIAIGLSFGIMSLAAAVLLSVPKFISSLFTNDPAVIAVASKLLLIAGLFQIFDGIQVVATGALRGAGQTRISMTANFFGHWILGLPIGCFLCFRQGYGIAGLWSGLSIGLITVAFILTVAWWRTRLVTSLPELTVGSCGRVS